MSARDPMNRRPNAEDVLAGLDPELAEVARRLVADASDLAPGAAFAERLAAELRTSAGTGTAVGRPGSARPPAPDDLGRSVAPPPLWAKVAVGILSVTLVYGLIASVFRPSTTPPASMPEPTSAAPAVPLPPTVATPSSSPTATSTPTPTPTASRSGPISLGIESTTPALPTPTRTLVPTTPPEPTARSNPSTPVASPSDTPLPSATTTSKPPTTAPTATPKPSETTPPRPLTPTPTHPTEVVPTPTPLEREPDATATSTVPTATPGTNDCVEACTRKSNAWYRECVGRGGGAEDCQRQAAEMRSACIRTECGPTP